MDQKQVALTTKRMINARVVLVRDNPFFRCLSLGLQLAYSPVERRVQMENALYLIRISPPG
mgnify:CR=1 FL=1